MYVTGIYPQAHNNRYVMACDTPSGNGLWQKRTQQVSKFADLLGTKPSSGSSGAALHPSAKAKALTNLFSRSLADHEVVLTLPSLDLGLGDSQDDMSNPLPGVGEHRDTPDAENPEDDRPTMAASVLTNAAEGAANSEQKAAQNIGKLTSWTKSTLDYASDAVRKNLSSSFAALVDSRVRAWTLLLLRHSLSTGDNESRTGLMSMLSSIIKFDATETVFKTLSLPETAAAQSEDSSDVVLPLLFEVIMHAFVQENKEVVTLRAPGTITAQFDKDSFQLRNVAIRLTSASLLNSMIEQARMIVLKTVSKATKTPVEASEFGGQTSPTTPSTVNQLLSSKSLAGFRSALDLSSPGVSSTQKGNFNDDGSSSLMKARKSALRLGSVLQQDKGSNKGCENSLGIRKSRSIKWDTPSQPPKMTAALAPSPKKQRKAETAARLKSIQSFGRPHAGDFGSGPRNATFAAGESVSQSNYFGRDGRLAHHPQPMQNTNPNDLMGLTNMPGSNATFDLTATRRRPMGLSSVSEVPSQQSLSRTPTALEMMLLKKSTASRKSAFG